MDNIKEKIQDKVMDCITFNAGGRLVVFKPENSGLSAQTGKDLVVENRGDYKKKAISLDVFEKDFFEKQAGGIKNLKPDKNFYLILVDFDVVKQDINDNLWIVPYSDQEKIAGAGDLSKFLISKKNVSSFFIEKLEAESR